MSQAPKNTHDRDLLPARIEMQERLDPLIAERAPWLYSGKPHHTLAKHLMMRLLRYPRSIELAAEFRDLPTEEIMRRISALIVRDLRVDGLENIPATGPALIVANHPTGIADGLVMLSVVDDDQPGILVETERREVAALAGGVMPLSLATVGDAGSLLP